MSQPGLPSTIDAPCDQTRGPTIVGVGGAFLFTASCAVFARLFIRTRVLREAGRLGLDDAAICIALLLAAVKFGMDCTAVYYGLGQHINCVGLDHVSFGNKITDISLPIALISLMTTRLSVCLFLLRLFTVNKNWRYLLYAIMAFIFATNVSSAAIILPQCEPRARLWNPSVPGTCWPHRVQTAMTYFNGVVSGLSDLTLSLLPTYFLWDVRIKVSTKVGICTIMGLGGLVTACPIVRTVLEANFTSPDVTWASVNLAVWTSIEIYLSIIAASMPALRPLISGSAWRKKKSNSSSGRNRLKLLFRWPLSRSSDRATSGDTYPRDHGNQAYNANSDYGSTPATSSKHIGVAGSKTQLWSQMNRSRTTELTERVATPPLEMIESGLLRVDGGDAAADTTHY